MDKKLLIPILVLVCGVWSWALWSVLSLGSPPALIGKMESVQWDGIETGMTLEQVLELAPDVGERIDNEGAVTLTYVTEDRIYTLMFWEGILDTRAESPR